MRADIQRKPIGFQEVTSPVYRCVSICVTRLTRSQEVIPHLLVFEIKGFLEQPSNTSLLQSTFHGFNKFYMKDTFLKVLPAHDHPLGLAHAEYP
jgi:hypothetical protein